MISVKPSKHEKIKVKKYFNIYKTKGTLKRDNYDKWAKVLIFSKELKMGQKETASIIENG